ncbi:MAG: hypothetical protein LC126_30210 [Bryobacterales bacterium]|nr:hypothetical protein [Bryobacterales bacterium]
MSATPTGANRSRWGSGSARTSRPSVTTSGLEGLNSTNDADCGGLHDYRSTGSASTSSTPIPPISGIQAFASSPTISSSPTVNLDHT